MSTLPRILHGLHEIAHEHDAFIVDQWGVLHDGHTLHPGARHALAHLRAHGPVALVSNTSSRLGPAQEVVRALGLQDDDYDAFFTAGELAASWLEGHIAAHGGRLSVLTLPHPQGAERLLGGLAVDLTDTVSDADVIAVMGITRRSPKLWDAPLQAAVDRGLPLLCANPDIRSLQPDGSYCWCPGAFAVRFAELGGTVHTFGKPRPDIYRAAHAALGHPARVAAFGDSLEHDIAGANGVGFTAVLVTRGIHGPDLGLAPTDAPLPGPTAALADRFGVKVDAALATFRW